MVEDVQGLGQRVKRRLNDFGYAFYSSIAPSPRAQALLMEHTNWPVFLVTPDIFSGQPFGRRLDAVFVFKEKAVFESSLALERMMALEGCTVSYEVFPSTEEGLYQAADQYSTLRHTLPVRI